MLKLMGRILLFNRWSAFIHDLLWVPLVITLCYWIRFDFFLIPTDFLPSLFIIIVVTLAVQSFAFWYFGLYRGLWRYVSMEDLLRVVKAVGFGWVLTISTIYIISAEYRAPRAVLVLYPILLVVGLIAPRIIFRGITENKFKLRSKTGKRTIIVGGGSAGELLIRELVHRHEYTLVAVVDDDKLKQGREIHGVRVVGYLADLEQLVGLLQVEVILIAIAGGSKNLIQTIVKKAAELEVECKTIPRSIEIVNGAINFGQIRSLTVEDLLGRESIKLDCKAISSSLQGKNVLVTGGGGSIGAELCRQIASQNPQRLIVFENSEFNLYSIEHELSRNYSEVTVHAILGDVKDKERVAWLFYKYSPEVVFHAAAYKHVPLVEDNPAAGVANNVFGTIVVANAADTFKTEKFVMVSTDKAVNPTNVMGATKRIAEIYCQNLNNRSKTAFVTTRFGNVLGSAGSVVPLFEKQIRSGGPVTVTSREVTRFFMTIPEATGLILQAGAMGFGGEIFILDMGEPVLIRELAEQMIKLFGYEPYVDIDIAYIGLRPGEKLYEELFHSAENMKETSHPKLNLAESREVDWKWIENVLKELYVAAGERNVATVKSLLNKIVPEYQYTLSSSEKASSVVKREQGGK